MPREPRVIEDRALSRGSGAWLVEQGHPGLRGRFPGDRDGGDGVAVAAQDVRPALVILRTGRSRVIEYLPARVLEAHARLVSESGEGHAHLTGPVGTSTRMPGECHLTRRIPRHHRSPHDSLACCRPFDDLTALKIHRAPGPVHAMLSDRPPPADPGREGLERCVLVSLDNNLAPDRRDTPRGHLGCHRALLVC